MILLENDYFFKTLMKLMLNNTFTDAGLELLFEILTESETQVIFDPIALRCDFTEYQTAEEMLKEADLTPDSNGVYTTKVGSYVVDMLEVL